MYDFTGCECAICHQRFKLDSDVVVCPDCGTPYHRDCYHSLGYCKHRDAHSEDFVWQPPEQITRSTMLSCPRCGIENEKTNEYCKMCGLSLVTLEDPTHQTKHTAAPIKDTQKAAAFELLKNGLPPYGKPLNQNETFEDVPVAEWISYIGAASPSYLTSFQQMKLLKRKYSFSFSAMLFGPLYFFYRKAWDIALLFTAIAVILNVPAFWAILIYSESVYAPAISENALNIISQISVVLSWVVMMLRGLYGNYLYKMSSAKTIKKIKAKATNAKEKAILLKMYGGTSFAAVILVVATVFVLASAFGLLLGPELDAMLEAMYY